MLKKSSERQLQELARYLSKKQDEILKDWENSMKQSVGESSKLTSLSRKAFQNDIPSFLERLNNSFQNKETSSKTIGKKHGAQRWEHGLNIQDTMREWNRLHEVLMQKINEAQEQLSVNLAALKTAQSILAKHIHDGILYSVIEYNQLQQKEAEAQLLDLKQTVEDPDKEARDQNMRGTSHDLKGIMQNIQMGFYLLKDENLNERSKKIITQMSGAADSLEELLNNLLDLFRLESGREEVNAKPFNVGDMLSELCENLQPQARAEKLTLQCTGENSLDVVGDSTKVQRIAQNLVLNGLKYTQEGHVEINWKQKSDHYWQLKISDTGPGLSSTHAALVTTRVDSSEVSDIPSKKGGAQKVQSQGEGIGLLIVRHLCQLLGAVIDIKTGKDIGTTFRIIFPMKAHEG